jgi:hypothetical protein
MSEDSHDRSDDFDENEEVLRIAEARWKALQENPDSRVCQETVTRMLQSR